MQLMEDILHHLICINHPGSYLPAADTFFFPVTGGALSR